MKLFIILVIISINLFAQDDAILQSFPGKWKLEIEKGEVYEEWNMVNDTEIIGTSYYFENDEKKILEILYIKKFADQWAYVALPKGQPITLFALAEFTQDKYVFENLEHDFPQKLTYKFLSEDRIEVTIEGVEDGKEKRIEIGFIRAD